MWHARGVCRAYFAGHDLNDAVQATFVRLLRSLDRFDERRGNWIAFVRTKARAQCRDMLREQSALKRNPAVGIERLQDDPPARQEREGATLPATWKRGLSQREFTILQLHFGHSKTLIEIAAFMAMPEGTVKSIYQRTLMKLRERLAA